MSRSVRLAQESALLTKLQHQEKSRASGLDFNLELGSGIVVDHDGHVRGVWRFRTDRFEWTPAGYSVPTLAFANVDSAADFTSALPVGP